MLCSRTWANLPVVRARVGSTLLLIAGKCFALIFSKHLFLCLGQLMTSQLIYRMKRELSRGSLTVHALISLFSHPQFCYISSEKQVLPAGKRH
jgi:hypothetical protein